MSRFLLFICLAAGLQACYDVHADKMGYYEHGQYYFWNGNHGQGEMKDGKKEGTWMFRDEFRRLTAMGSYLNDSMHGTWFMYYPNGVTRGAGPMRGNAEQGHWILRREDGTKESEGTFKDGIREGEWTYYHANEQKMSEGRLTNENRVGKWNFYYASGQKKETRVYENGLNMLAESFFPDGRTMVVNGDGTYEYWENGKVLEKGAYADSLATGEWSFFDSEGNLTGTRVFVGGIGP
ncbi:MAG: hypothetical protein AAF570_20655 [Bacteroidota bacterium]